MNGTIWTKPEQEVVDNAWDPVDAWENYRVAFGFDNRTFESIKRRWYRVHAKVTA